MEVGNNMTTNHMTTAELYDALQSQVVILGSLEDNGDPAYDEALAEFRFLERELSKREEK